MQRPVHQIDSSSQNRQHNPAHAGRQETALPSRLPEVPASPGCVGGSHNSTFYIVTTSPRLSISEYGLRCRQECLSSTGPDGKMGSTYALAPGLPPTKHHHAPPHHPTTLTRMESAMLNFGTFVRHRRCSSSFALASRPAGPTTPATSLRQSQLSRAFRAVSKRVIPSVVKIKTTIRPRTLSRRPDNTGQRFIQTHPSRTSPATPECRPARVSRRPTRPRTGLGPA